MIFIPMNYIGALCTLAYGWEKKLQAVLTGCYRCVCAPEALDRR